jgi:2-amino-4-hydroxy-6-hydroxymethyldihydropteridine diphosphokinase
MSERFCLLSLGGNMGSRRANLRAAIARLPAAGIDVERCSSLYDTDPVGEIKDQRSFLNMCLIGRTGASAQELLERTKAIELALGRDPAAPRHAPRPVDIDILLLGAERHERAHLRIPHPALLQRRFYLIPALELDLSLRTPAGESLAGALLLLDPAEGVRFAYGAHELHGAPGGRDNQARALSG